MTPFRQPQISSSQTYFSTDWSKLLCRANRSRNGFVHTLISFTAAGTTPTCAVAKTVVVICIAKNKARREVDRLGSGSVLSQVKLKLASNSSFLPL